MLGRAIKLRELDQSQTYDRHCSTGKPIDWKVMIGKNVINICI